MRLLETIDGTFSFGFLVAKLNTTPSEPRCCLDWTSFLLCSRRWHHTFSFSLTPSIQFNEFSIWTSCLSLLMICLMHISPSSLNSCKMVLMGGGGVGVSPYSFLWPLKHSLSSFNLLTCVSASPLYKKVLVSDSKDHCVVVMLIACIARGDLASLSVMLIHLLSLREVRAVEISCFQLWGLTIWYEVKGAWGWGAEG